MITQKQSVKTVWMRERGMDPAHGDATPTWESPADYTSWIITHLDDLIICSPEDRAEILAMLHLVTR